MFINQELNTLKIEDLPVAFEERELRKLFGEFSRQILTFYFKAEAPHTKTAFVALKSMQAAKDAHKSLNYSLVNNRPIHVSIDSEEKSDANATLLLSDVPLQLKDEDLHKYASSFGNVIMCRIRRNIEGASNGSATVQFASESDAKNALESLNKDKKYEGLKAQVFLPSNMRQNLPADLPDNVIAVDGASDESAVRSEFTKFGKIFKIQNLEGKFLVFFENSKSAAEALKIQSSFNLSTKMPREVIQTILSYIEARSVYLGSVVKFDKQEILDHMSSVGKINHISIHITAKGASFASVEYSTPEERDDAIAQLDMKPMGSQPTPIRVLPHVDIRVQHKPAGLLQLNEITPSTTVKKLKEIFQKYGTVLTTTIVPSWSGNVIGFVLFQNYDDAMKAQTENGETNALLYPQCEPSVLVSAFAASEKAPNNCLVIYNLPQNTTDAALRQMCHTDALSSITSSYLARENTTITGFIFFSNSQAASHAFKAFQIRNPNENENDKVMSISADVLNGNCLMRAKAMLRSEMPADWVGRVLYVSGVPDTFTNADLRKHFEPAGGLVSAFTILNPINGTVASALVVYRHPQSAQAAICGLTVTNDLRRIAISPFKTNKISNNAETEQKPLFLMPMGNHRSPREFIKKFIFINVETAKQQSLIEKLEKLAVNQTYDLVSNMYILYNWTRL